VVTVGICFCIFNAYFLCLLCHVSSEGGVVGASTQLVLDTGLCSATICLTIILTYQAIGRSVINYAAPLWALVINESSWKCLHSPDYENEALRIATGCHKMAHLDHLQQETKTLPIKSHSELLAKQYWLSCYQSHHLSHHLTSQPAPARNMKGTLSKFDRDVVPLCDDGISEVEQYRSALHNHHSEAVVDAQLNFVPNRVLGTTPPELSSFECYLSRSVCTTLVQLSSGHCRLLNSYKACITAGITDVSPDCGVAPHSVEHLFQYPACLTQLTTQDLWDNPDAVADFLKLDDN